MLNVASCLLNGANNVRIKRVLLGTAFLSVALLTGCATTPPTDKPQGQPQPLSDYANELISPLLSKAKVVGLSALVVDKNGIVWSKGFGYADKQEKVPATEDTVYHIGSITKLFTALAVVQLVEQGQLNLSAPVSEYLADFAAGQCYTDKPVTVAQLLTHQSGLHHSFEPEFWTQSDWRTVTEKLSCDMAYYPPETLLSYSNIGFTLLGAIVEQVSGVPYEQYIQHNILQKLDMHTAGFDSAALAKAYTPKKKLNQEPPLRDVPAGGMLASTVALAKFAQYMLQESAIRDDMLQSRIKRTAINMDNDIGWGWFLKPSAKNDGSFIAEHSGSNKYHHSVIQVYPAKGVAVVILANSGYREPLQLVSDQLLYYAAYQQPMQAVKDKTTGQAAHYANTFCAAEQVPGYYHSELGLVNIQAKGEGFVAHIGGTKVKLRPAKQSGYFDPSLRFMGMIPLGKYAFGDLQLSLRCTEQATYAAVKDGAREFSLAYKVEGGDKTELLNERWLGKYHVKDDPSVQVEVSVFDDNLLFMREGFPVFEQRAYYLLSAQSADSARVLYLGEHGPKLSFSHQQGQAILSYQGFLLVKDDE
jgi:CubicO group peptidase (beta-lactamase class C family)